MPDTTCTATDSTTAPKRPHEIYDVQTGEVAGEAPGIDERDALETFQRDVMTGHGTLFETAPTRVWRLYLEGAAGADTYAARPRMTEEDLDQPAKPHEIPPAAREWIGARLWAEGGLDIEGDDHTTDVMWFHAYLGLEVTDETPPTQRQVAERVAAAWTTLYLHADA